MAWGKLFFTIYVGVDETGRGKQFEVAAVHVDSDYSGATALLYDQRGVTCHSVASRSVPAPELRP